MKKLISCLALVALLAFPILAYGDDGIKPTITEATIFPNHVTAGETVYFIARATDADKNTDRLDVGVFALVDEYWFLVTRLQYHPDKDIYLGSVDIPETVPNAEVTLYFIAKDANGVMSDPVPRDLFIYSVRDIAVALARGCILSDTDGAAMNFTRHNTTDMSESMKEGLKVRRGTVLFLHSWYDGVWYDGSGSMGTTLRVYIRTPDANEWVMVGEDTYRSDVLDGPALRKGVANVALPCRTVGNYQVKLIVASASEPVDAETPFVDEDTIVFNLTVVP